jgi:alanine racemase
VTASGRVAEIDLDAIRHNLRVVRERLPAGSGVIAVVKANGYGHGAQAVAGAAMEAGAVGLAVSTLEEARALSGLCPPDRVLAMGGLTPDQAHAAAGAGCALVCHSAEIVEALERVAPPRGRVAVHLKVDTGMSRLGCAPAEAPALARRIAGSPRLRLAGVMTHFASAECDEAFTRAQHARFLATLDALGVDPGLRHACNSAAALRYPGMALDAVRCGIELYGCEWPGLRPALRLRAPIVQVKDVAAGARVGYGGTWAAPRPTRLATVAIGYEDGVLRARSNRGGAVVRGRRAPLVGRVSMDQLTLDVTDVPGARPGDMATLIGDGITAEEVAAWSGTISYEVLTAVGRRVKRVVKS